MLFIIWEHEKQEAKTEYKNFTMVTKILFTP